MDELREAAAFCVEVFYELDGPFKALQRQSLLLKFQERLLQRASDGQSKAKLLKGCLPSGKMVAFAELSVSSGALSLPGLPVSRKRALISNLAVARDCRRQGAGRKLCLACEQQALAWGFDEILLLVEHDNTAARSFYARNGFEELCADNDARRYDTTGWFLRIVQTTKLTLRKTLTFEGRG